MTTRPLSDEAFAAIEDLGPCPPPIDWERECSRESFDPDVWARMIARAEWFNDVRLIVVADDAIAAHMKGQTR